MQTYPPKPNKSGVTRMLQPPHFLRSVRIPNSLFHDKLKQGWRVDPDQEDHYDNHRTTPGRHEGSRAFVAASGPSMGLFPRERILAYAEGMVKWATNNAWEVCRGAAFPAEYLVIMDEHFFLRHEEKVLAYLAEYDATLVTSFNVSRLRKWQKVPVPMTAFAKDRPPYRVNEYFHGKSSGVVAIQMALHAGCSEIHLLGHDCTTAHGMTHGNGVRHQHELVRGYPQGKQMVAGYELVAEHARQLGVRTVSLSPVSTLQCFEKETIP